MIDDFNCMIEDSYAHFKYIFNLEENILKEMAHTAITRNVRLLRAFNYTRVFYVVGIFSHLEAKLSDNFLRSNQGFLELKKYLKNNNQNVLLQEFEIYLCAINVLKHGEGRSYQKLINEKQLPFNIKKPHQSFFFDGDISEINTLIKVDDNFINLCVNLIKRISNTLGIR